MTKTRSQELPEALDLPGLATDARTASENILARARARADFRREYAVYLASGNTQPEALQVIENRIAHELQVFWDAHRGETGIPTNDVSRKRLLEQTLAVSREYQQERSRCLDLQHQADILDEEYQAARRAYNQAMACWWQSIFALTPNLELSETLK